MKQVTLKIPEKRFQFFIELVTQLGFEIERQVEIGEEQKKLVRERVKTSAPENLVPWEEAKKKLR